MSKNNLPLTSHCCNQKALSHSIGIRWPRRE